VTGRIYVCFRGDEPDEIENRTEEEAKARCGYLNRRDGGGWTVEPYVLRGNQR
jgi:hypothetical protein